MHSAIQHWLVLSESSFLWLEHSLPPLTLPTTLCPLAGKAA